MSYQVIIKKYLSSLQQDYQDSLSGNQHTAELSFRPPLDTMFRELATVLNGNPNIVVILEPKNQARMGRPDWRMHDRNTLGVYGYIEAKGLSQNTFDIAPYEEQFNRYLSLGHKLIITDGIDFVYSFTDGMKPKVVSLIDKSLILQSDWSSITPNIEFEHMMRRFFSEPSPQYYDEGSLVEQIAIRTRYLSDEILRFSSIPLDEAMDTEEKNAIILLDGLKQLVYNHNDSNMRFDSVFADFAAQVIMFTILFAHRVECTDADSAVEKERKIREYLSREIVEGQVLRPFLTIIHYINNQEDESSFILSWTDECISFLSFVHMTEQQRQHPDYHKLFELFLSKFDARSRFDYGAFYTPIELADFIVRFTETITKRSFEGNSIFSDGNIIIDPCCGTGSFLESIRRNDAKKGAYLLCGYEILPAPYMLANYRMAILDTEINESRSHNELLLANTLSNYLFGTPVNPLTVEGYELNRAYEIASRPITLVIGNPPSSDSSKINTGDDFSVILDLMDDFRPPVQKRHLRQNIQKQINNPHLQFLRWACEKLDTAQNHSVLALIVPSSFLEADSYKFARKYIIEHFSNMWIISIDADARAGIRSDSLFNTQQGRAILFATRRYEETLGVEKYRYYDLSRFAKSDKTKTLAKSADEIFGMLTEHDIDEASYSLCPSIPFNHEIYSSFWPVSNENDEISIFQQYCSGIKLAPTSIFTHLKAPMLKRRSKEIMFRGNAAAKEWMAHQDKPPKDEEISFFANELISHGDPQAVDTLLNANIVNYAFRPFLTMKAFLWQDLLHKFSRVGGGGTRRRPEISAAFSAKGTIGFALSHSPKDQKDRLRQFASFCWYHPDNDLCRRGNSYIYLNQYPVKGTRNRVIENNIHPKLGVLLSQLLAVPINNIATEMVFYTFAVLCSQVYLDEFEGALFTVNRADMRPRIPIVNDADVFRRLSSLGQQVAELEKRDYFPANHMGFDYEAIQAEIPEGFKLKLLDHLFDEEREILILTDGLTKVEIPCPSYIQSINIAGYDIIKNVWMKFNSYNFTHSVFSPNDVIDLLNLINKLIEYVSLVGQIDVVIHDIIEGAYPLLLPTEGKS